MKRKKLLSIVMTVVLSLCSLSPTAVQAQGALADFPEEGQFKENRAEGLEEIRPEVTPQEGNVNTAVKTEEGFYDYEELEDGTLEITNYKGNDTELVVPAEIDGKRVTSIGKDAFYNCRSLTGIELPTGVTSIGEGAFHYCDSLTSIKLPAGVTSIGKSAFSGCSSLIDIELPAGVTSIGENVFLSCSNLMEIMVDENNPAYVSQDGVLYNKEQTELIRCPEGTTGNIVIPAGVTSIGESAFCYCRSLTGIELPAGVTNIECRAFYGCSSLASIELPAGVTNIVKEVFCGCSSLASIELPAGVTSIGDETFRDCNSLTDIELPTGVTSIGDGVFYNCRSLTGIELPAGVTSIGCYTFLSF